MMRDPRLDPQPGDVLGYNTDINHPPRRVVDRTPFGVYYTIARTGDASSRFATLDVWQAWARDAAPVPEATGSPDPVLGLLPEQVAYFWSLVDRQEPDECWLWKGQVRRGYGAIKLNGKDYRANRVAWILQFGRPLGRLKARHTCDVPACCNPRHLVKGTQKQNLADMRRRGRHPTQSDPARDSARLNRTRARLATLGTPPVPGFPNDV